MTIRKKIIGGLAIMTIIGLIFGIIGLVSTQMLTNLSNEMYALQNTATSITNVLNAHYTWRHDLTESVLADKEFTGSLDPGNCSFGKWKAGIQQYNITDPQVLTYLNQIDAPHTAIHTDAALVVSMMKEGNREGAIEELEHVLLPETAKVISLLSSMETRYGTIIADKSQEIIDTGNRMGLILIVSMAAMLALGVALNFIITGSVMTPLRMITAAAKSIAAGDMDVQVEYKVNDQIGQLVDSFHNLIDSTRRQITVVEALSNGDLTVEIKPRSDKDAISFALQKMTVSLNEMFAEINNAAALVSAGSRQIANGAQSLAQGSTEQASSVDHLSATIGSISEKTKLNFEIAREAAALSGVIKGNAEKGSNQMQQMMQAVQDINEASGKIEKVIRVIDDIASQTNILALNAAVEAARAGSAGKGFAVVAEEVRNLAAKSAAAAKDTGVLIENSVAKADLGMNIANETSASLREIVEGINRSSDIVGRIAKSSEEQADVISTVNTGIEQVAHVVQMNSATAQESAAASQEMSGQSDILAGLIAQFKLKESAHTRELPGSRKKALSSRSSGEYSSSGGFQKY